MAEQTTKSGWLSRERWFGPREKVELSYMTDKERAVYHLGILCRWIAHFLWFAAYSTFATFGYLEIAKAGNSGWLSQAGQISAYTFTGCGHLFIGGIQGVVGLFTREKVSKTKTMHGNPIFKRSLIGIVLATISLLPPLIYGIGRFIIWLIYRKDPNKKTHQKEALIAQGEQKVMSKQFNTQQEPKQANSSQNQANSKDIVTQTFENMGNELSSGLSRKINSEIDDAFRK